MYRERLLAKKLQKLAATFPVVAVSGARQVGKTTLVRHEFPALDYVVLDPTLDRENARGEPDLFLRNHPFSLIVDEIQYAPELVGAIKRTVDAAGNRPGMFILTGSQQWQVMRSLAESLAGRVAFLDLQGFALPELSGPGKTDCWLASWLKEATELITAGRTRMEASPPPEFTLLEWLWRGSLPGVWRMDAEMVPEFWAGYHRTYVERDARLAGDVEDWQQFGLFLRLAGALSSQEVNGSQLGRDIGMTPQTARRWLRVLEATFQWFEVPAFKGNAVKRVSSKPKGYLTETGLICHHAQISSPKALGAHPLLGALFETAMVSELRKQAATLVGRTGLHHWRSAGGAEVDLLLERDGVLFPFEIKLTANPSRRDASGIAAFRQAHPHLQVGTGAILCAVERPRWVSEDVAALPWNLV